MTRCRMLFLAAITLACASSGWALDTYTGSLSKADGGLEGNGSWFGTEAITTLDWTVSENANGSWRYDYTLSIQYNGGNISHMVIETSTSFGPGDIVTTRPYDIKLWEPGGGAFPNMPGDLYGVKFDTTGEDLTMNVAFDAWRTPVWGDFYAVDGQAGGDWNEAWNAGFLDTDPTDDPADGSIDDHLLVPDTETQPPNGDDAPELGTWLLLACTGVFGAALRRRKS